MTLRHLRSDVADWWYRNHPLPLVAGTTVAALLIIGLVVAGETELIEGDPCHQIAATSPSVAAQVTDPTVELLPSAPVGSVATDCEGATP